MESEIYNLKDTVQTGEYIALLYTDSGDPMGTMHGNDLDYLINNLKNVTSETNCTYILLEIIDNFLGKTIH